MPASSPEPKTSAVPVERHWLEFPEGIPPEDWGSDHLSTLLYAETRAVDHAGWLPNTDPHMRSDGHTYPTRLANDGGLVYGHSDWECLKDFEKAGLVTYDDELRPGDVRLASGAVKRAASSSRRSRGGPGLVRFTDDGWAYVHALRRKRAESAT